MSIFLESGLTFHFSPGNWAVRKYDEHEYYQALSGSGLKGMDFVAIWENRQLVLIEVKNYRQVASSEFPSPSTLLDEITRKVEDTFTGLSAIRQMLERKSLYRIVRPIITRFPVYAYDWPFWTRTGQLSTFLDQSRVLLILEGYPEALRAPFKEALIRELSETVGTVEVLAAEETNLEGLRIE